MRKLQIFLLVIILLGIGLIFTQKLWVPRVVDYLLQKDEVAVGTPPPKEEKNCYAYHQEKSAEVFYAVDEKVELIIAEDGSVTGTKSGTQAGPDMTNGYQGMLVGSIAGDLITVNYNYSIEGSSNTEQEEYKVVASGLMKQRYPLVEKNKILVPDKAGTLREIEYKKVACVD